MDKYPYCEHSILMGKTPADWQNTIYILKLLDNKLSTARRKYRDFVKKGIEGNKRHDLTGGGSVRSSGEWSALKSSRKSGALQKGDERTF